MILKFIPNSLTIMRLILIAPFLFCLYHHRYDSAFFIFIAAGLSDGLDGWLARHYGWQSALGSMLDPVADKLLVMASFISLALLSVLPWWLVLLVILRDISISFGALAWFSFIKKQIDFEPTKLSKLNTTFQLMLVTVCLLELAYFQFPRYIVQGLIVLTTITTSATFFDYVWTWGNKAWRIKHPN